MAVNSDGVNPTQECKGKKTWCAFVHSCDLTVLCFSFLVLFLYRDGSDIGYRYRGDSLTFVYILGCDAPRFVDGCASVGPRVFPVGRVLGGYFTYVPSTHSRPVATVCL